MQRCSNLPLVAAIVTSLASFGCGGDGKDETTQGAATIGGTETINGVNGNTTTGDWCPAGLNWSWTFEADGVSSTTTGPRQFKGETYCHAVVEADEGVIDYYFQEEDGEWVDIWMVIKDSAGNVLGEMHTVEQGG